MKDKIVGWLVANKSPIEYTIGGLNVLSGLINMISGNISTGLLNLAVGAILIHDAAAN